VVVDSEEGATAVNHFPVCDDGLARVAESLAIVDTARIEAEGRTRKDFVPVGGTAWVGVEQADFAWVVEERSPDVAAGCATVLVVDWVDINPQVVDAGDLADRLGEGGEGEVGVGHAVVGLTRVVLYFLQEHDRGCVEVVDDVLGNELDAGVIGCKVLDVVIAEGEAIAFAVGGDGRGRWESVDRALDFSARLRENSVEAEDVCDDTSDVLELVAKLGCVAVAASI